MNATSTSAKISVSKPANGAAGPVPGDGAGQRRQFKERVRGEPYRPGQFDHLLSVKRHAEPSTIRSVAFELTSSGRSLVVTENLVDGSSPRRIVSEFPDYIDFELEDGRSVQIEVRVFDRAADDDDELPESLMVMPTEPTEPTVCAACLFDGVPRSHD